MGSLRKLSAGGFASDWFINMQEHLFSSINVKIILGKHSIFPPRHLYPTNNKKLGRKMRKYSAIEEKKKHHLKLCS